MFNQSSNKSEDESPLTVLMQNASDLRFSSLQNLLKHPDITNHVFTPEEGQLIYKMIISSDSIRMLNLLVDAGISAEKCVSDLEFMCETEDLEKASALLRAGAQPTEECVHWAVTSFDYQMIDLLYQYGADKKIIQKEIREFLQSIEEDPVGYAKEQYNEHLTEEIQAYLNKFDDL